MQCAWHSTPALTVAASKHSTLAHLVAKVAKVATRDRHDTQVSASKPPGVSGVWMCCAQLVLCGRPGWGYWRTMRAFKSDRARQ